MKANITLLALAFSFSAFSQNLIDQYLSAPFTSTMIADGFSSIDNPRDLDFKPNTNELWVVNLGDNNGGTNVILYNAGLPDQAAEYRKDSHTSHFMLMPSSMAFSDFGEWGTVGEAQNSGGSTSTFMGPVIWSSDTNIFARAFQSSWANGRPLGSHLDMLHQSPFGMGIAHDSAELYWIFDGHNNNICLYDFVTNHGPGYEDHSNGVIWRYTDIDVEREPNIPSHIIKDKESGWLYIVDTGHNRILRIQTQSGAVVDTLSPPGTGSENLDGYYEVQGVTQQSIDTFATRPCGIDLYNGRLIVGDYDNGNIYVYDISGSAPIMLGTIATGQAGMQGIKIGPDGKIWFVNNTSSEVYRLDPAPVANDAAILDITSPLLENAGPYYYNSGFNLCNSNIEPVVTLLNTGTNTLTSVTINYTVDQSSTVSFNWTGSLAGGSNTSVTLPSSAVIAGKHRLQVFTMNPNGNLDHNPANDRKEGSFRAMNPVSPLPFSEGFTSIVFPPQGWDYINYNPNNMITRDGSVGGFGQSTGCFKMNNFDGYEDITGQIDYLTVPLVDLGTAASAILEFSVAHARYNTSSNDNLKVLVSDDCGLTWDIVYNKSGSTLATAPNTTGAFVPSASQWRRESVDLSAYLGSGEVLCMFSTLSDFGNFVYVDDILIYDQITSIAETISGTSFELYPIPANGTLNVRFISPSATQQTLRVQDASGRTVMQKKLNSNPGSNELALDIEELSKGIYTAILSSGSSVSHSKFVVQ